MTIEIKISEKEYIKLMLALTYQNLVIRIGTILICAFTVLSLLMHLSHDNEYTSFFSPVIAPFIMAVILPLITYLNAKKSYNANTRLQENIKYEFTGDKIITTGELFTTERSWDKTYKVLELKSWILIYESRTTASLIPKQALGNKLDEFKNMIRSKPNIKQKLK